MMKKSVLLAAFALAASISSTALAEPIVNGSAALNDGGFTANFTGNKLLVDGADVGASATGASARAETTVVDVKDAPVISAAVAANSGDGAAAVLLTESNLIGGGSVTAEGNGALNLGGAADAAGRVKVTAEDKSSAFAAVTGARSDSIQTVVGSK